MIDENGCGEEPGPRHMFSESFEDFTYDPEVNVENLTAT